MKQIIVVTDHKERFESEFMSTDLIVTWCSLSVESLLKERGRSNIIFVCMDHDDKDTLKKLGLYLRDICIEDEKILYLYGNMEDVDTIRPLIPKLFVANASYSFVDLSRLIEELQDDFAKNEKDKPVFLIIDDDVEYAEKLRVYLDPYYRFFLCRFNPEDIAKMASVADVMVLCLDGSMKLVDFMELFRLIASKKKNNKDFKYYYLAGDNKNRAMMNAESEKTAISFSKEMGIDRIAKFLIDLAAPKGKS